MKHPNFFDPYARQYRTCCCHVRTCAALVGILELFWLLGEILHVSLCFTFGGRSSDSLQCHWIPGPYALAVCSVAFVVGLFVITLLFAGLCLRDHRYLVPHLIVQVLLVIAAIVCAALTVWSAVAAEAARQDRRAAWKPSPKDEIDDDNSGASSSISGQLRADRAVMVVFVVMSVVFLLAALLEAWFIYVVYKCYVFLKDQRAAILTHTTDGGGR